MTDVRDPRPPKFSPKLRDDPRPEPNRDMLAVNRRWLKHEARPKTSPNQSLQDFAPRGVSQGDVQDNLARATYRYTKNPSVLNDNLGYGERLKETFWVAADEAKLVAMPRISQRTRTGRQVLDIAKKK